MYIYGGLKHEKFRNTINNSFYWSQINRIYKLVLGLGCITYLDMGRMGDFSDYRYSIVRWNSCNVKMAELVQW